MKYTPFCRINLSDPCKNSKLISVREKLEKYLHLHSYLQILYNFYTFKMTSPLVVTLQV